jgi:hypothetical protein
MLDSLLCIKEGVDSQELSVSYDLEKEILIYINTLGKAQINQFLCRLIYRNGMDKVISIMYMEHREGRFP